MHAHNNLIPRWDIHEEHVEDAAFLWMQWERALLAPDFDLEETAELEGRLRAHLEALAEAGAPVAHRLLRPALLSDEPERVSAATYALVLGGCVEAAGLRLLLADSEPGPRAAIQRALQLIEGPAGTEQIRPFLADAEPALQALALEALAFLGVTPGPELEALLNHDAPGIRASALRCARRLPPDSVRAELLRAGLVDAHPQVRWEAIVLGLQHGARAAWHACLELARTREEGSRRARVLMALGGGEAELRELLGMLGGSALQADVLWALGFSGRVAAAEACLEMMRPARTAALAAEAFSAITGLAIAGPHALPAEPARESSSREEDLDADLTPRPEDSLPLPAPEAVSAWWIQAHKGFEQGTRYLAGKPASAGRLLEVLGRGPMRRRHMLSLELSIRSRGAHQLQTRAWARRQRAEWTRACESQARLPMQPLSQLLFR
ncbi:TIGR02270 family protein [Corallococcus sicarius]|uniref:TIGR02270 family protein n=1 Tax=Corallococcus sicarius TaxID=2316726 RepID=A0A3A8MNG4_9BACT|nr:TIGR02270 family protein [Corallococcus sicarius]RKH30265.1 TIGR02270 family protein [Corallococcus sicarius]